MIRGVGNDIIEVSRIEAIIAKYGRRFLDRIFTTEEQEYCLKHRDAARHFAGRFAAKESIAKALGVGIGSLLSWLDIEIFNDENGKPCVFLSSKAQVTFTNPHLLITISHCREYANAVAIWSQ